MSGGLPERWIEIQLEDIIQSMESGGRPKGGVKGIIEGIPSIGGEHLNNAGRFDFSNIRYVPEQFYKGMLKGHIAENDILIVKDGATTGKVSFVSCEFPFDKAVVNEHVFVVRIVPPLNKKFVFYFLWSQEGNRRILENFQGSAQGGINKQFASRTLIPMSPLKEQKRIVVKLDAIMPRIDSVKDRLEKIPAILKRFRQSVLTAAVTGKLTEKWREEHPEVESAEELLESIFKAKQALFKQNGVSKSKIVDESDMFFSTPVNWKWCRLSEITLKMSTGPFGTMLHKSDYIDNGIPVINPTNIIGEKIIASDKITISKSKYEELLRYSLKENNIVLARRGDLSKCGIVRKEQSNWLCGTGSFFLEVAISPVYFRLFYVSNYCQAPLNEDSIGSTMSNLNQSVLSNIAFPLPPLDEQKEIVRQVGKLFALADKVEVHYQKARSRVDALAQSVLAKAFRGELVPQHPDDESAEKLLKRIQEEKALMGNELKNSSRSARRTRRNGAKTQRAGSEEKQAGEP